MANYIYDFDAMDAYLLEVETTFGAEISEIENRVTSLTSQRAQLQKNLYRRHEDGKWCLDTNVQSQIADIDAQITELKAAITKLKGAMEEARTLITTIKAKMNEIDFDYKEALDAITDQINDFTYRMEEYFSGMGEGILGADPNAYTLPLGDLKNKLMDVGGVSEATIREVKRRIVYDRFGQHMLEASGVDGVTSAAMDYYKWIDGLMKMPGVQAVTALTLGKDPRYVGDFLSDSKVSGIISDVEMLQSYLGGNFPIIIGAEGTVFFGADQRWYIDDDIYNSGCGFAAASNWLAYFILKNEGFAKATGHGIWNSSRIATVGEFTEFMQEVYDKSFNKLNIGTTTLDVQTAMIGYYSSYGFEPTTWLSMTGDPSVPLNATSDYTIKNIYSGLWDHVTKTTSNGIPIVLGSWLTEMPFNRIPFPNAKFTEPLNRPFYKHYVTITDAYINAKGEKILVVSSWGERYEIDFDTYSQNLRETLSLDFFSIHGEDVRPIK